jgi:hypothetical protein
MTEPRIYAMDNAKAVQELIVLGQGEAEKIAHRQVVREQFLNGSPILSFSFSP